MIMVNELKEYLHCFQNVSGIFEFQLKVFRLHLYTCDVKEYNTMTGQWPMIRCVRSLRFALNEAIIASTFSC